jgi:5-methylcytosine-specific restriction endonuclease McrA
VACPGYRRGRRREHSRASRPDSGQEVAMGRKRDEDTWAGFVARFRRYRQRPMWTGMSSLLPSRSGKLTPRRLRKYKAAARRATERLSHTVRSLKDEQMLPPRPSRFTEAHMNRIVRALGKKRFRPKLQILAFWEAIVFERGGYACCYCGRSADEVYRALGRRRALRLVVDHHKPWKKGGKEYSFQNCVAACWSCNTLKAHWPLRAFKEELRSLAHAVLSRQRRRPVTTGATF